LNFPCALSGARSFSELLEFHKQIENFAVQRFSFTPFFHPVENHLAVKLFLPSLERPILIS